MLQFDISTLVVFFTEITALIAAIVPTIVMIMKIINGQKCQLRSEMLQIYYSNREAKTIREYEFQNFVLLYEAYKALKGNSFIDTIYGEVKKWEIVM